jgi:hypothetical protein
MNALRDFQSWKQQAPQGLSRWPGAAVRIRSGTKAGQIDFRRGRVIRVSEMCIDIEADMPSGLHPLVKLMGDSYIHFCRSCKASIPGNVTYQRNAELRAFCPYCGPSAPLLMVSVGDHVRLHYRFETEGKWAGWYAEIWEW